MGEAMRAIGGTGGSGVYCCALLLLLLGARTGHAETFTLAGHTIRFEPPPGYCFVTRDDDVGAPVYRGIEGTAGPDVQLIAVYVDCDELKTSRANRAFEIDHLGAFMVVKTAGEIGEYPL